MNTGRLTPAVSGVNLAGMTTTTLGPARFPSPQRRHVSDSARIPSRIVREPTQEPEQHLEFELAGPRAKIYFEPANVRAAIVTCGGLCPGLNNVIRSLFLEMYHCYGVKEVFGFREGYQGLDPVRGKEPVRLSCEYVDHIHRQGGTVLGTSRGPVDIPSAVENLIQRRINVLFTIGGDGTQRGANEIFLEARRRGYELAVVGVPKTIDNDVAYVSRTFGFLTAIEEAAMVLDRAHIEAHSVHNGIALVKLMGREAGFIAAVATVASQDVNFTLIPEVPFKLNGDGGFLPVLKERLVQRAHALIVVAEGAGQHLLEGIEEKDASGNKKLQDFGVFLKGKIEAYFKDEQMPVTLRYIDPSYLIRSVAADAEDAVLCDLYARHAVHAAMAGKTGLVIGFLHDRFIHVPIDLIVKERRRLSPESATWHAVLACTGQPDFT